MAKIHKRKTDADVEKVQKALEAYKTDHPSAEIEVYRYNSCSIRICIIDPDFKGQDRVERDRVIWTFLDRLHDDVRSQVTMIVLLVPGEEKKSLGYLEFKNPSAPIGIL
jgi:hypothetical protein